MNEFVHKVSELWVLNLGGALSPKFSAPPGGETTSDANTFSRSKYSTVLRTFAIITMLSLMGLRLRTSPGSGEKVP